MGADGAPAAHHGAADELVFERYRLVPMGSFSSSSGWTMGRQSTPLAPDTDACARSCVALSPDGSPAAPGPVRDASFSPSSPPMDAGMVAFLDCLKQFKARGGRCFALSLSSLARVTVSRTALAARSATSRPWTSTLLPYQIDEKKGKIHDLSIRIQFNTEESWTKACKLMLTNLNCLAWMTKLEVSVLVTVALAAQRRAARRRLHGCARRPSRRASMLAAASIRSNCHGHCTL